MSVARKAGDRNFIEGALKAIMDNAYTRAYGRGVGEAIHVVDRRFTSDEQLAKNAANSVARRIAEEIPGQGRYRGPAVEADMMKHNVLGAGNDFGMDRLFVNGQYNVDKVQGNLLSGYQGASRQELLNAMAWGRANNLRQSSGIAEGAALVLGNPAAAYGVPAAGLGLATWGIHDLIARAQAGDPQAQAAVAELAAAEATAP